MIRTDSLVTGLGHSALSIPIQLGFGYLLNDYLAGGIIAILYWFGREVAQHEYKIALKRDWVWGTPKPIKFYEGFILGWSVDSIIDIVFPVISTTITFFVITKLLGV